MSEPQVVHCDHRFEVHIDGDTAGCVTYRDWDDQRIFIHTQISPQWSGRGIGSALLKDALDATVEAGKRIVPVCDFVAGYVDRHDEYTGIVDNVTPEVTNWLRGAKH